MLHIFNSLTRKIEPFHPIHDLQVGMYTCGPTVYDFAHIGNFRTYTTADILVRTLQYNGYEVKYIINLTDVGHLTGDNLGDADLGEDRLEKSAKKEGKTAWEVAAFYTEAFLKDFEKLQLTKPQRFVKATDHIKEQIDLVKQLEEKGFTYTTTDGVYFDTSKFEKYGELSNLDEIKAGARVEINPEKKNARDFALWKFSPQDEQRQMEWKSPWGVGFPGWHIECSAMAMKYLGPHFDIHAGGIDLRETHHPNEIAQSEAATEQTFVNYWVHSAFMLVSGQRMSKSLGNNYKLYDLEKEGYDAMTLRYVYLQTHYRQEMNFTFAGLDAAANAVKKLREEVRLLEEPTHVSKEYSDLFLAALNDDLNTSKALAVVWELLKSDLPDSVKHATLLKFDTVLGLQLDQIEKEETLSLEQLPRPVRSLIMQREEMRKMRKFAQADQIRNQVKKLGYDVQDGQDGITIKKI
jgi:cysteinyl-tRNA synthetase